jgi:hypothetical protein
MLSKSCSTRLPLYKIIVNKILDYFDNIYRGHYKSWILAYPLVLHKITTETTYVVVIAGLGITKDMRGIDTISWFSLEFNLKIQISIFFIRLPNKISMIWDFSTEIFVKDIKFDQKAYSAYISLYF